MPKTKPSRAALVRELRPLLRARRAQLQDRRKTLERELRDVKRELVRCACMPASVRALQKRIGELGPSGSASRKSAKAWRGDTGSFHVRGPYGSNSGELVIGLAEARKLAKRWSREMGYADIESKSFAEGDKMIEAYARGKPTAIRVPKPSTMKAPELDWEPGDYASFATRVLRLARKLPGKPLSEGQHDAARVPLRDVFEAGKPWFFGSPKGVSEWADFGNYLRAAQNLGLLQLTRWDMLPRDPSGTYAAQRAASEINTGGDSAVHLIALD